MKHVIVALVSFICTVQTCFGGVDYYSNSAVTANTDSGDGVTFWQPINGNTQFNVSFVTGGTSTNARLSNANTTAGGLNFLFTTDGTTTVTSDLQLLAGSTTFNGTGTLFGTANLLNSNFNTIKGGYSDTNDGTLGFPLNYFGWVASDSNNSTTYTGWANIEINPDGSTAAGSGTTIVINEWAYNVGTSITVGDRILNNTGGGGGVPEPTGFAIIGLAGLAVGLKRRNRR